jgi:hypothetical protein
MKSTIILCGMLGSRPMLFVSAERILFVMLIPQMGLKYIPLNTFFL